MLVCVGEKCLCAFIVPCSQNSEFNFDLTINHFLLNMFTPSVFLSSHRGNVTHSTFSRAYMLSISFNDG